VAAKKPLSRFPAAGGAAAASDGMAGILSGPLAASLMVSARLGRLLIPTQPSWLPYCCAAALLAIWQPSGQADV
jgi:hypothetical protein